MVKITGNSALTIVLSYFYDIRTSVSFLFMCFLNVVFKFLRILPEFFHDQGPDFDDMSSFFPCEIDNAIQYINLGYGVHAPKIVIYNNKSSFAQCANV